MKGNKSKKLATNSVPANTTAKPPKKNKKSFSPPKKVLAEKKSPTQMSLKNTLTTASTQATKNGSAPHGEKTTTPSTQNRETVSDNTGNK